MLYTEEHARYIDAMCQIETGILQNGELYLPFADLVAMVLAMPPDNTKEELSEAIDLMDAVLDEVSSSDYLPAHWNTIDFINRFKCPDTKETHP